jgi:hypothetical protein
MSGGFNNPLVSVGGTLVYPSIHSPNFNQATKTGWSIDKNGNAFFFGIVTSGAFEGTNFVINSSGAFFYSGTPAAGNLFLALASVAGSDGFGNTYVAGLQFTDGNGFDIEMTEQGGAAVLRFATNRATEASAAILASQVFNSGAVNETLSIALFGPREQNPNNADVGVQLNSAAKDGSIDALGILEYLPAGSSIGQTEAAWNSDGLSVRAYNDGNAYDCARGSLVVASTITVNSTSGQTIMAASVAAGTYRVHGFCECLQGGTAVAQFIGFGGPATGGGPTRIRYWFVEQGNSQEFSTYSNIGSALGDVSTPAYAIGATFFFEFEGVVSFSAAGTFGVTAASATGTEIFEVISGSIMDLLPCVQTA